MSKATWSTRRSRLSRFFLLIPLLPTLIYVLFLLFYPQRDLLILWRREFNVALAAILPLIACVLIYGALALWLARRIQPDAPLSRTQKLALIALLVIGGLAIQWAATRVTEPDPLVGIAWRTYAIKTGGYWSVGATVQDVARFIGEYAQHAPDYPVHQNRHPPGLALIFWLGVQMFKLAPGVAAPVADALRPYSCLSDIATTAPTNQMAAGAFGMAVEIVLAMAAVWPLYALVKRLAGRTAAVWAALLYPLTPGFGMWVSQFDRGFALATAAVLLLTEGIVTENSTRKALLAGLVLSVATFASFGNVPIAMIAAVYALVRIWQTQPRDQLRRPAFWRARALQGLLVILGALSIWALAYAFFGLNPVTLYRVIFASHLSIDFPYWPFVVWHPWDIMTFIGLPLVALTLFAVWKRHTQNSVPNGAAALAAAFAIPLFTLSVLAVARGETGRVWLFFTPLAVGAAAIVLVRRTRLEQGVVVALLALQLVVMTGVLRVLNDYGVTPQAMPPTAVPDTARRIDTRFGATGQIALLAYQLEPLKPGGTSNLTLYWQRMSAEPIDTAYKVFIHVAVDQSDQARLAAQDAAPYDWQYPTTCWQPNQIVADVHPLNIPADAKTGTYPVFVGLYDPVNKVRPPTFASPPTQLMYGSLLLPDPAKVVGP